MASRPILLGVFGLPDERPPAVEDLEGIFLWLTVERGSPSIVDEVSVGREGTRSENQTATGHLDHGHRVGYAPAIGGVGCDVGACLVDLARGTGQPIVPQHRIRHPGLEVDHLVEAELNDLRQPHLGQGAGRHDDADRHRTSRARGHRFSEINTGLGHGESTLELRFPVEGPIGPPVRKGHKGKFTGTEGPHFNAGRLDRLDRDPRAVAARAARQDRHSDANPTGRVALPLPTGAAVGPHRFGHADERNDIQLKLIRTTQDGAVRQLRGRLLQDGHGNGELVDHATDIGDGGGVLGRRRRRRLRLDGRRVIQSLDRRPHHRGGRVHVQVQGNGLPGADGHGLRQRGAWGVDQSDGDGRLQRTARGGILRRDHGLSGRGEPAVGHGHPIDRPIGAFLRPRNEQFFSRTEVRSLGQIEVPGRQGHHPRAVRAGASLGTLHGHPLPAGLGSRPFGGLRAVRPQDGRSVRRGLGFQCDLFPRAELHLFGKVGLRHIPHFDQRFGGEGLAADVGPSGRVEGRLVRLRLGDRRIWIGQSLDRAPRHRPFLRRLEDQLHSASRTEPMLGRQSHGRGRDADRLLVAGPSGRAGEAPPYIGLAIENLFDDVFLQHEALLTIEVEPHDLLHGIPFELELVRLAVLDVGSVQAGGHGTGEVEIGSGVQVDAISQESHMVGHRIAHVDILPRIDFHPETRVEPFEAEATSRHTNGRCADRLHHEDDAIGSIRVRTAQFDIHIDDEWLREVELVIEPDRAQFPFVVVGDLVAIPTQIGGVTHKGADGLSQEGPQAAEHEENDQGKAHAAKKRRRPGLRCPAFRRLCHCRSWTQAGTAPAALAWSARNFSRPLSVSGCLSRPLMADSGPVMTSAPIWAHSMTCMVWRTEAARISVLNM